MKKLYVFNKNTRSLLATIHFDKKVDAMSMVEALYSADYIGTSESESHIKFDKWAPNLYA